MFLDRSRRYVEEVSVILKEQDSEELWVMRISTLLEALIELEAFSFLFSELFDMLKSLGVFHIFMKVLEPFILRGQVRT